jgi:hypothetical protein
MPVIITKDGTDYHLVPAPLVTFNKSNYNNVGRPGFGSDYTLSLQGTFIQTHGNPYYASGVAALSTDSWTSTPTVESTEVTAIDSNDLLDATIKKQEKIRSLFTNPVISGVAKPIKITVKGWDTDYDGSGLSFQAFVDEVSFDSEGRWANPGTYSVSLRTSSFLSSANSGEFSSYSDETSSRYKISTLSESFDISEDGQKTLSFASSGDSAYLLDNVHKVYTVNRSVAIVGSPVYDESGNYVSGLAPWQQASGYLYEYLGLGSGQLPDTKSKIVSLLGSSYNIANTVYQEAIDREAGSYTLTETYLAYNASSPVIETITISEDVTESERRSFNVQGNIQGLNTIGGFETSGNRYANANSYWDSVSSGVTPDAYFYAQALIGSSGWVHPKPTSHNVSRDFAAGSVGYSYTFDDRPPNIIPGSISETITVNDTYPGEIFSVTPVIGRNQPVIQYLNSRSEHKRSLSINVVMGAQSNNWTHNSSFTGDVNTSGTLTTGAQAKLQTWLISQKPSVVYTGEFNNIYQAVNPVNDPNFTVPNGKCFHSTPTESWDAKSRTYTYNIEWTYERL